MRCWSACDFAGRLVAMNTLASVSSVHIPPATGLAVPAGLSLPLGWTLLGLAVLAWLPVVALVLAITHG